MRSIWRLRRLAIQGVLPPRQHLLRLASTTSAAPIAQSSTAHPSTSPISSSSLSSPQAGPSSLANHSNSFFTPLPRPAFPTPVAPTPLSPSEAAALSALKIRLLVPAAKRDDAYATETFRVYKRLSRTTRFGLSPYLLKHILRAVVPHRIHLENMTREARDPLGRLGSYIAQIERRTQWIIGDMRHSTYVAPTKRQRDLSRQGPVHPSDLEGSRTEAGSSRPAGVSSEVPDWTDYRFVLSVLASLGGVNSCENVYAEAKASNSGTTLDDPRYKGKLLVQRVRALTTWLSNRTKYAGWTIRRAPMSRVDMEAKVERESTYKLKPYQNVEKEAARAALILGEVLQQVAEIRTIPDTYLLAHLIESIRRAIAFLPPDEDWSELRKSLVQVLEELIVKGYGLDLKYLQIDPIIEKKRVVNASVINAIMALFTERKELWKMVETLEVLGGSNAVARNLEKEDWEEEVVEGEEDLDLRSSHVPVEEESSASNPSWLGHGGEIDIPGSRSASVSGPWSIEEVVQAASRLKSADLPLQDPAGLEIPSVLSAEPPIFLSEYSAYHMPLLSPAEVARAFAEGTLETSNASGYHVNTETFSIMLASIAQHGDLHLALHVIRTALRMTAEAKAQWLQSVLAAHQTTSTERVEPPRPKLMVSAKWFEQVHLPARRVEDSSHVKILLRQLMEREMELLQEEYTVLTGREFDATSQEFDDNAPISIYAGEHALSPSVYLNNLTSTHQYLKRLLEASQVQHVTRRLATQRQVAARWNVRRVKMANYARAAEADAQAMVQKEDAKARRREERRGLLESKSGGQSNADGTVALA